MSEFKSNFKHLQEQEDCQIIAEFEIGNNEQILNISGELNKNLRYISKLFNVKINIRENYFRLEGNQEDIENIESFFTKLNDLINNGFEFAFDKIDDLYSFHKSNPEINFKDIFLNTIPINKIKKKKQITPKTLVQKIYVESIKNNTITFGIGPAGTGKTYLAIAMALSYFTFNKVGKVILTRPAVEAGERLGFLPGNITEKVNPYLRPLYDALNDILGVENVLRLIEKGFVEIAPLAFMRGRTLNDSFIILDEAQNTTSEQMKMFLTRLGFNSKAVITGDITQIDLPNNIRSGLVEAEKLLKDIKGIAVVKFSKSDVVRHKIVKDIIKAYESK
jgi:phosphate starvation-inducible PhoH-like protein